MFTYWPRGQITQDVCKKAMFGLDPAERLPSNKAGFVRAIGNFGDSHTKNTQRDAKKILSKVVYRQVIAE